ncbi:deoxyribonuclease gamma [Austrofundulus limnaeus]|uniref:Deoxyribonuclease n=1 Tax=Austrofundulus limnaeus TaxID=52670 RepID=A0A2I4C3M9_AUSLI|nr:PREDICTED: deoxyribonuclease gamma-like [Austrofundulus limnaeus]
MKVAAFNMKNLGMKKVSDSFVSKRLIEIMSQYSIVLILEVVDKNNKAMELLQEKLNKASERSYKMARSACLGRDTYKEQYVYFYREDEVKLEDEYQYEDNQAGDEDAFAREPYVVHFKCPNTVAEDLVLIPVHTKPEDAQKEIDELYDVVTAVREKWGIDNIIILGDFNADGRYLSAKKKKTVRICKEPFHWLIDDSVDTTASNCNDETYDRIVVYGSEMLDAIVPDSAKAFNFQKEFKLTDEDALRISDHYPVEVELKTKAGPKKTQPKKKGPQKDAGAED